MGMNNEVKRIIRNIVDAEANGHNAYAEMILKFMKPKLRKAVKAALKRRAK